MCARAWYNSQGDGSDDVMTRCLDCFLRQVSDLGFEQNFW